MSIEARREYLAAVRERYQNSSKKQKSLILNELCAVCGYSRSYVIGLLCGCRKRNKKSESKAGRRPIYGYEVSRHLNALWIAMNRICSKKLKAALPIWLPFYDNSACTAEVRQMLLQMSASTVDRHLHQYRYPKGKGLMTTRSASAWIKSRIPIELLHGSIDRPGFVEADTVGHCGTSTQGQYVNSLTMTDLQSGWTENRACIGKSADSVLEQIKDVEKTLPFLLLGFACDNGTEFLNESLFMYFIDRQKRPIHFVRRRPYKKNDAAHVEQKNWTHVRQLFGYDRLEDPSFVPLMNEIYREYWNPLLNYFMPSLKLVEKTRIGGAIKKRYENPQTPYQRLMESPHIYQGIKMRMTEYYRSLNPFKLRQRLDEKLKIFFRLVDLNKQRVA